MASTLEIRNFVEGGSYHIFNRGNRKQKIFRSREDYSFFLSLFDCYLVKGSKNRSQWVKKEFTDSVELFAYCLMPNHFHIVLGQKSGDGVSEFMRSIGVRYTAYLNKKYDLVGHTFQGRYKARTVSSGADFLHLSRYVHLNPLNIVEPRKYQYSSLRYYLGEQPPDWLNTGRLQDVCEGLLGIKRANFKEVYSNYCREE